MQRRWRLWWLAALPLCAAGAGGLLAAEALRNAGHEGWASLLDVARLALYWAWMHPAWRWASELQPRSRPLLVRGALLAGLLANAFA
ncbi:MAG TPA: hypothetical protein VFB08_01435 [Burkholderiales bacterium]|nr:hypothetical protein [Burkholderiales bacterium]